MDEQVVFHKLGRNEVRTIAGLMLQETLRRVRERGYSLQLSQRLVDTIMKEGHSDEYGVRPLRQTVVRWVRTDWWWDAHAQGSAHLRRSVLTITPARPLALCLHSTPVY